jgi:hypothetical protein
MAKSLDQVQNEKYMQQSQGVKVSSKDVELAVRMTIKMLQEGGGLKVIKDAINQSKDPAQVIGQMLATIAAKLGEKLQQQFNVDPRIFLAKGGWLEHILDWIEQQLGYPKNFSNQIYQQVLEVIKAAAQRPPAPNNVTDQGQVQPQDPSQDMPDQPGMPTANDPRLPRQPGGNY